MCLIGGLCFAQIGVIIHAIFLAGTESLMEFQYDVVLTSGRGKPRQYIDYVRPELIFQPYISTIDNRTQGFTEVIENHPYVVSISRNRQHIGVGALLSEDKIITVAYNALYEGDLSVRAGSTLAMYGGKSRRVVARIIHPNYTNKWDYNVAVLQLDRPFVESKTIQVANLVTTATKIGAFHIVGFHHKVKKSEQLRLRRFNFYKLPDEDCKTHPSCPEDFSPRMDCALFKPKSSQLYNFGAPVFTHRKTLIGLFVGFNNTLAGYTDVTAYRDWLIKVTGISFKNNRA